jgi:hypothetical protein
MCDNNLIDILIYLGSIRVVTFQPTNIYAPAKVLFMADRRLILFSHHFYGNIDISLHLKIFEF